MLFGISGNLGSGKTLFLTYYLVNEYINQTKIYANYDLFNMDYFRVESPADIYEMEEGFFGADELWLWADSRMSMSKRNKFVSFVLARSRHSNIDIAYTTQSFLQIDVRIRRLTDIMFFPRYNKKTDICSVEAVNAINGETKSIKFKGSKVFKFYDTHEKIQIPDQY